ncbi:hypothetical protein N7478_003488 [Penicillium angulare]|uniref:uncharacterized protein n=1 Tax=Penicillium angulare TaxID=116970 RepID=UPI0025410ECF|nr:uncharacterized protein N7478_003488 [Penicillium angulare]KAJ5287802.1 hypothetical protein N7478_003488 [Penicillium angulare]
MQSFITFGSLLVATAASYFPGGSLFPYNKPIDKRTAPAEGSDGICYSYVLAASDTCSSLAAAYDITEANIESYNTNTWDWYGCSDLYQGAFICLSPGAPPMPVALPQATCGPQVPGTTRPSDMSNLASLNPCPSNECCSTWGHCGTISGFCDTANCIWNCGVKSASSADSSTNKASSTSTTKKESSTLTSTTSSTSTTKKSTSTTKKSTSTTKKSTSTTSSETSTKNSDTTTSASTKTVTSTSSAAPSTETWQIVIYAESKCEAVDEGYYVVVGFNSMGGECLRLAGGDIATYSDGPDPYCRWYPDAGKEPFTSCASATLTKPKSYYIYSGDCVVYSDADCKDESGSIYNPDLGCQRPGFRAWSPQSTFGSMICSYL